MMKSSFGYHSKISPHKRQNECAVCRFRKHSYLFDSLLTMRQEVQRRNHKIIITLSFLSIKDERTAITQDEGAPSIQNPLLGKFCCCFCSGEFGNATMRSKSIPPHVHFPSSPVLSYHNLIVRSIWGCGKQELPFLDP